MPVYTGSNGVVKVGATPDVVGEVREWSINQTGDTTESSVMGDSWRDFLPTLNAWTASITAYWSDDDTGQGLLVPGAAVAVELYPAGESSGMTYFQGTGIVTGANPSAAFDGMVEIAFELQGQGALTTSTVV